MPDQKDTSHRHRYAEKISAALPNNVLVGEQAPGAWIAGLGGGVCPRTTGGVGVAARAAGLGATAVVSAALTGGVAERITGGVADRTIGLLTLFRTASPELAFVENVTARKCAENSTNWDQSKMAQVASLFLDVLDTL